MARHPHSDNTEPDEGLVSRWSRRKQQVREQDAGEPVAEETVPGDPVATEPQQPVKTDDDMPPVDSITESSSVADFFSPGVSEQLRKMALRKLFQTAKFNVRDGLDDYDEDFRDFAALGDIITADMRHQKELAEARAKTSEADPVVAERREGETDIETATAADQGERETGDGDDTGPAARDVAGEDQPESEAEDGTTTASEDNSSRDGKSRA